jgi:hypothetical protein
VKVFNRFIDLFRIAAYLLFHLPNHRNQNPPQSDVLVAAKGEKKEKFLSSYIIDFIALKISVVVLILIYGLLWRNN